MQNEKCKMELSLVIPAYNERRRLPAFLRAAARYLEESFPGDHEIIVVDDGSQDGLSAVLGSLGRACPVLSVQRLDRNRGKGAAVRTGMLAARGRLLLFADADGATPIEEERKLRREIDRGADLAIGSRRVPRPWTRWVPGRVFAWTVHSLLALPYKDTQCGFKMFRREAGLRLFQSCREQGFLFDVEILYRAQSLGFTVAEVPVSWSEMPGSRVSLLRDAGTMLGGLLKLRRRLV